MAFLLVLLTGGFRLTYCWLDTLVSCFCAASFDFCGNIASGSFAVAGTPTLLYLFFAWLDFAPATSLEGYTWLLLFSNGFKTLAGSCLLSSLIFNSFSLYSWSFSLICKFNILSSFYSAFIDCSCYYIWCFNFFSSTIFSCSASFS